MQNGQMTNYIMPTSADLPDIRVFFEELGNVHGAYGAKGIGELPMTARLRRSSTRSKTRCTLHSIRYRYFRRIFSMRLPSRRCRRSRLLGRGRQ